MDVCCSDGTTQRNTISKGNMIGVPALFSALRKTTWGGLFPVVRPSADQQQQLRQRQRQSPGQQGQGGSSNSARKPWAGQRDSADEDSSSAAAAQGQRSAVSLVKKGLRGPGAQQPKMSKEEKAANKKKAAKKASNKKGGEEYDYDDDDDELDADEFYGEADSDEEEDGGYAASLRGGGGRDSSRDRSKLKEANWFINPAAAAATATAAPAAAGRASAVQSALRASQMKKKSRSSRDKEDDEENEDDEDDDYQQFALRDGKMSRLGKKDAAGAGAGAGVGKRGRRKGTERDAEDLSNLSREEHEQLLMEMMGMASGRQPQPISSKKSAGRKSRAFEAAAQEEEEVEDEATIQAEKEAFMRFLQENQKQEAPSLGRKGRNAAMKQQLSRMRQKKRGDTSSSAPADSVTD
jgi:hypothetical protein